MFTGIVEEVGTVRRIRRGRASAELAVAAKKVLEDARIGDSIAVNGICLTVTGMENGLFTADVMHETLSRTSFSQLSVGSRVNLERAMAADGRFGGHIVAGHVDGVGTITEIKRDDNAVWYTFRADAQVMRYIVEKGSITVDGISLTVARVGAAAAGHGAGAASAGAGTFSISAIPHTVAQTVLRDRKKGDLVNLENDIIGKYVEKLLYGGPPLDLPGQGGRKGNGNSSAGLGGITKDFLMEHGFS